MRRLCLTHWTERGEKVPAEPGEALCASCMDSQAERAHEALVGRFFGSDGPTSDRERDAVREGWRR